MKKTVALVLLALLALGLTACAKTTETKSENQITVFAAAPLEQALTEIAQAYTNEDNEQAPKNGVVLFSFKATDALGTDLADGAYCDIFIPEGVEQLDGRDLAGPAVLMISAEAPADGSAGAVYPVALLNMSDRQEAAQAFIDYFKSDAAKSVWEKYGFTVG